MSLPPMPISREDTFVIETADSDSVSGSCLQYENIDFPAVKGEPTEQTDSSFNLKCNNHKTSVHKKETQDSEIRNIPISDRIKELTNHLKYFRSSTKRQYVCTEDLNADIPPVLTPPVRSKLIKDRGNILYSCHSSNTYTTSHNDFGDSLKPEFNIITKLGIPTNKKRSHTEADNYFPLRRSEIFNSNPEIYYNRNKDTSPTHTTTNSTTTKIATVKPYFESSALPSTKTYSDFLTTKPDINLSTANVTSNWKAFRASKNKEFEVLSNNSKASTSTGNTSATVSLSNYSHKITSKMARFSKSNYLNENFEDVLKERNEMMNSERIYRKRIRQLEEELKGMVIQCQTLSDENKELRKSLDGIKGTGEKSGNLNTVAKVKKLESDNTKLLAGYEAKIKEMDSVLSDNTKLKVQNNDMEIKVRDLEKQVISLNKQKKGIESEIEQNKGLQKAFKDLEYENRALEAKIKSLEYDKKTLTSSLEEKRRELEELTQKDANSHDIKDKLEDYQEENKGLKQELEDIKKALKDTEASKQRLQDELAEKVHRIDKLDAGTDKKEKLIANLRKDLDTSKKELQRLGKLEQEFKDAEKESTALKSRIGSLKTEIDGSLEENQRLRQEIEEMSQTIEKLRQDHSNTTEASKESKKYLRNWEQEKEFRIKVDADLQTKKEEVSILETALKERESKVAELNSRINSLENERMRLGNSSLGELELDNRGLKDENMKLRQMLVERNIELTNTKHEQTVADSRIRHLEHKQKNAEVRVKELSQQLVAVADTPYQEENTKTTTKTLSWNKKGESAESTSRNKPQTTPRHNNQQREIPISKRKVAFIESQSRKQNIQQPIRSSTIPVLNESAKSDGNIQTPTKNLTLVNSDSTIFQYERTSYISLFKDKKKRVKGKVY